MLLILVLVHLNKLIFENLMKLEVQPYIEGKIVSIK